MLIVNKFYMKWKLHRTLQAPFTNLCPPSFPNRPNVLERNAAANFKKEKERLSYHMATAECRLSLSAPISVSRWIHQSEARLLSIVGLSQAFWSWLSLVFTEDGQKPGSQLAPGGENTIWPPQQDRTTAGCCSMLLSCFIEIKIFAVQWVEMTFWT